MKFAKFIVDETDFGFAPRFSINAVNDVGGVSPCAKILWCGEDGEKLANLFAAAGAMRAALVEYVERHEAACDPSGLPEYEQACAALALSRGES